MHSYLPLGIISPFAEVIPQFGGLLERLLVQEYPEQSAAVLGLWKKTVTGWFSFHNRFTKDNITLILNLRELQMAMLSVQGISNKEIARRFYLSEGRQKAIMHDIYAKLFISNRKELKEFIPVPEKT